tara:strand:- start:71 stop:448 length:378 start_codon:yes stop_codon:yes gene_type:complete
MPRKKGTTKAKQGGKKAGLDSLSQTHGKEEGVKPTSLDQIWGDTGLSKYKTLDKGEYEGQIKDMNKSDLQTHATKVGLVPVDDMPLLRRRLMKEFEKHVAAYRVPNKTKSSKLDSEAVKILSEGK